MQTIERNNREDEIKRLMEENQRLLKLVLQTSEKTRKYILWGRIMSAIYLFIIIAPIVLAVIFLPPFFRSTLAPYKDLLQSGVPGKTGEVQGMLDNVQQFLDEYGKERSLR